MIEFVRALFDGATGYMEIREIDKAGNVKQLFLKRGEIANYKPPNDKNIYFGVYDRSREDGTSKSCESTGALWADYDDGRSLTSIKADISEAGLPEPSIVVNSGHGLHCYWLLTERTSKDITSLLKAIASKTGADPRPAEQARVMRLPQTMNVKKEPVPCELVEMAGSKYPLKLFTAVLGVEPTEPKHYPTQHEKKAGTLEIEADRPCIRAMLQGVQEGERNFILGRITKWLQLKGYDKKRAQRVILAWNKQNKPPENENKLLKDFNAYWHGDYKLLGCALKSDPALQQILSKYCNRAECGFFEAIGRIKLDNSARYNNRLLDELPKLTGNDLIVYGLLARHREGLTTSQLIEKLTARATGKPCMHKNTMLISIESLRKLGVLEVINGYRKAGRENLYKAKLQGTFGKGYTLISNGAINGAIDGRVTAGELRLYVLLLRYAFSKGNCYPSTATLAKDLRTNRNNISNLLGGLEKADYIKRDYRVFRGAEKLFVTLLV